MSKAIVFAAAISKTLYSSGSVRTVTHSVGIIVGLFADPERLSDIRRNRVALMEEGRSSNYTDITEIKKEVEDSKKLFKKYNWPTIDVTRKSVEETAASIIKIIEISKNK